MKNFLLFMLWLLTMSNCYAQNFKKMLFPLYDPITKCIGCVDIKGDTIIPFEYKNCYGRVFYPNQGWDSGYMNLCRYSDEELLYLHYNLGWGWLGKDKEHAVGLYNGCRFELTNVSSDSLFIIKKNGLVGVVDSLGKEVIPCIYNAILLDHESMRLFHKEDGLASVLKNGKMGCVYKNGKLVIPCIYDNNTSNFMRIGDNIIVAIKNGKDVYIDNHGRIVNPPNDNNEPWKMCSENYDSSALRCVEKNDKHGCVDKNGKLVIPFISDTHIYFNNNGNYASISQGWNLEEGIIGKFGYINRKGEIVIPCKYAYASDFIGKYAIVETLMESPDGMPKYLAECIDAKGNVLCRLGESNYGTDYRGSGFYDTQSLSYNSFVLSSNGYLCGKHGEQGFSFKVLDGMGYESLTNQIFDKLSAFGKFKKGIALVEKNGQRWFINEKGENILHEKFDDIGTVDINVTGNVTKRLVLNDRYLISEKNGLKGLVDIEKEKVLTPCIYNIIGKMEDGENLYQEQIHQNMVKVKRNGKFGYVDVRTGEEIIPCEYNKLTSRFKKFQYLYNSKKSNVDENVPINGTTNPKCYALIIANEKYKREPDVPFAINDGKMFTEYCKKTLGIPVNNVHYVEDATLNDIKYHLAWLKNQVKIAGNETKVIFYYAGHGVPNDEDRTSYILPCDGFALDINTGFCLKELYKELGNLPSQNVIAFIDACFSGAQRNELVNAETRRVIIKPKAEKPTGKLVVFSASQGNESALPYEKEKHGLFTYFLLKKLQDTKGDVSLGELVDYVKDEVTRLAVKEKNKIQTPSIYNSSAMENWESIKLR